MQNGNKYILHLFLVSFSINMLITSAVHFTSYYLATDKRADIIFTKFFIAPKSISDFFQYILSVDYWSAKSFKTNKLLKTNKSIKTKNYLGSFIEKSNRLNLGVSAFVFALAMTSIITSKEANPSSIEVLLRLIWAIRTISRSFEIIFAFGKDVIGSESKKSSLEPEDRIKLAILSHIEITLNYSIVYYTHLYFKNLYNYKYLEPPELLCEVSTFLNYFFISFGISTLTTVSFSFYKEIYQNLFVTLHIITAMALILFALAKYVSDKK